MKSACNESFKRRGASKKAMSNKSVPWWTEELKLCGKGKRVKMGVPKDEKQRRTERTTQNTIFRRESKVRSNS